MSIAPTFVTRLENLGRALTTRVVLIRVAAVVLGLTACYLVAANVLLQTRVLRNLVNTGPDIQLEYGSAYSVWPGRVRFSGLRLRVQDYNVQFAVSASGVVDVSLHDLFRRRFRAVRLTTTETSFRMRHKLQSVAEHDARRVAAYPPIAGFEDPPLYAGPKPPPLADADYKLWAVALENVSADLSEIWVLEYRYVGGAHAAGSFQLAPARSFQVEPSTLELDRGTLMLGDVAFAKSLKLSASTHIQHTDVSASSGIEILKAVSAKLDIDTREVELAALDVYLKPGTAVSAREPSQLAVSASVTAGQVDVGSHAQLQARGLVLTTRHANVLADLSSSLRATPAGVLEWVTSSPLLQLQNASDHKGPAVDAATFNLQLLALDLTAPVALRRVDVDLQKLTIPSLGWTNTLLREAGISTEVGGRLDGQARVVWGVKEGLGAQLKLLLLGGTVDSQSLQMKLAGHIDMAIEPSGTDAASVGRMDIELDGIEIMNGKKQGKPFRAALRSADLRVVTHPKPQVSGHLAANATPAEPLLSLWLGSSVLKGLAASLFELERLDASIKFRLGERAARVELSRAQSGSLKGKGYWQRPAQGESQGAFLITTNVANAGLTLTGSETKASLFVSDDWLPRDWAVDGRTTAEPSR